MGDIKFACPHCAQHITCDELWAGHQLECPSCKNQLAVPAAPAPQSASGRPLVPAPPATAQARVTLNKPAAAATAGAGGAPQRTIPSRNLAPPPKKKGSMVTKFATAAAVLVLLGAGVYFGYPWISGMQNKVD